MTLRLKINLIVGALMLLFVAGVFGLQWRNMHQSVREEVIAANKVAAQLLDRTVWRYAAQGVPAMLGFLQGVGRVRSNEILLFDAQGHELYRSPPSPYKAGRDAPDWFERLIAPAQAEQSIAFPDGKLVVRSNASRAIVDAWDDTVAMVGVSLGLLVVVNGLVFWLVGRAVRPFGTIVQAMQALEGGRFDAALPPLAGREAASIGAAFNRMVAQLQAHIETERRAVRAETQLSAHRELTRWIDHQIEQERRVIARELHDEFGQSVTAMRSMALSIAQRLRERDPTAEQAARLIADESSRLYDAMHGIIPRLTPLVLDSFGLAEALADLAERTQRAHPGVRIALDADLGGVGLSGDAALALYRAAQEGMTNALRHGGARRIAVALHANGAEVSLAIEDDGSGLPSPAAPALPSAAEKAPSRGHYGLRWLAERVEGLGGRCSLGPGPAGGAQLEVRLPLAPTDPVAAA